MWGVLRVTEKERVVNHTQQSSLVSIVRPAGVSCSSLHFSLVFRSQGNERERTTKCE